MSAVLEFTRYASGGLKSAFSLTNFEDITEIRIRLDKPLIIQAASRERYLAHDGSFVSAPELAYRPSKMDIHSTFENVIGHSPYAFLEEIRNGFITMPGGNRIGISGQCVVEDGRVKTVKNVTGLCVRAARQIQGIADKVIRFLLDGTSIYSTVIISPPGCGKTTLLRDIVRHLSNTGFNIGVADERGEIAGGSGGQIDIGARTDVLDGCPKAAGLRMLLRSMSPDILVADEIGRPEELDIITDTVTAGVKLIITAHGAGVADLKLRPMFRALLDESVFKRFIVLGRSRQSLLGRSRQSLLGRGSTPGEVLAVLDERFTNLLEVGGECCD